jgi:hypothetical protein
MRLNHFFGAALGTGLLFLAAGGAQAYDHDRDRDYWRHEEWRREHRHEPRYVHERPVVVRERPIYVEQSRPVFVERARPVIVQQAPMYAAPIYPQSQGPSGLNLNFNIPLN